MDAKAHWDAIYSTRSVTEVSWYQAHPQPSLELIQQICNTKTAQIIDVGGGASTLVDHLLDNGFVNIAVLDISKHALAAARSRLGSRAQQVIWIQADVTAVDLPAQHIDLWHDRAVFHFLVNAEDRSRYIDVMSRALKKGGSAVIGTFALDGPTECSGLTVARYSPESLLAEFGEGFRLLESRSVAHDTPFGTQQQFVYCVFRKL